ncbi:MAG: Endoribonuclease YbeY [Candidatus Moanabacter tarae]|uniref:Endoribonuclease YbeY n=1 Tax=Candidatus Moanibacter tarae TaxID=2200854 RepID=A0A2Z4ABN1_9BACT|nr:MAG: Endoribonuclease YbeY [Candidatus Moanabacter tarae]|tara:strand:- start:14212 stop:14700 length:489 start_codon:yes stop_codon:yes gene_type:complete
MQELKSTKHLIEIANRSNRLQFSPLEVKELFAFLEKQSEFQVPSGTLSIAFLKDQEHTRIHQEYMDNSSSTDVITFPGDPDMGLSGEICVSVDFAEKSAQFHKKSFDEEITLYLLHGWLHLSGFDDRGEAASKKMSQIQNKVFSRIQNARLVPKFHLKEGNE